MDIKEALLMGAKTLRIKKILADSASLDAEVLLSFVVKKPKEYIFVYPEKTISNKQKKHFLQCIQKRLRYMPIAYIIGEKEFYGRKFFVNKNVLIPRPATELLADAVIQEIKSLRPALPAGRLTAYGLRLADVGTGSGCIAITLAKELKNATIYATEISTKALMAAKKNAKYHRAHINFFKGSLFEPLQNKKIDIVVANLPYLDHKDKNIYKKIISHEPRQALYAKDKGLKYYNELFRQISEYKIFPIAIFCEIMPKQKMGLKKIAKQFLPFYLTDFIGHIAILKKAPENVAGTIKNI